MINPEAIIAKICNTIDQIIENSKPYKGLFPSILHSQTGDMLIPKPPKIPGQRDGDRAHLGSNLIHDEPLLATMNTLADTQSKPEYAEVIDRYLESFARNCTQTATGLFPWSEHSFWHLYESQMGPAFLIHGLARVALLALSQTASHSCPLGPNYTAR